MNRPRLSALAATLLAGTLAGCTVVTTAGGPPSPGGPPPHAPAWGARAKKPPKVTITPAIIVIPGTAVSFAENYPDDLFFFQGRWYRPYDGQWWWSVSVSGDWLEVAVGQVPRAVLEVPGDYRQKAKAGKGGPPPHAPAHGRRAKEKG